MLAASAVTFVVCRQAPPAPTDASADLVAENNRAVGLMGRFQFDDARAVFESLASRYPNRRDLLDNLAIATLNRQRDGDDAAAQTLFERVLAADPNDLRAQYGLGLLLLHAGKARDARPHFQAVVAARPEDPDATYFAAQSAFALADYETALRGYERARTLDPHLRSAAYGLFLTAQRLGRAEDARRHLDAFQELEGNPQSRTVEFKYTRMGALGEVATIDAAPRAPAVRPSGPVMAPAATPLLASTALPRGWSWRNGQRGRPPSITTVDLDGDGRLDVFVAAAFDAQGQTRNAVLMNRAGGFSLDPSHPLAAVTDVNAVLWGDYDNDGLTDVYFCRRGSNQLWRQTASARWADVTTSAHAAGPGGDTVDGALFDADHEGDLDLFLVRADGPNELLNNNGDGTFRPIAGQAGVAGDGKPSTGVVVADLDNDRDLDLLVVKASPPHDLFINDRLWRYHRGPGGAGIAAAAITAAVAGDTNADGRVEIYSSGATGITRWTSDRSGTWTGAAIAGTEPLASTRQLALADVQGDGRFSVIAGRPGGGWQIRTMPETGASEALADASSPTGPWSIAVLSADAGPSIVALAADGDGAPVLWQRGPGRWPFVTLSFTGRDSRSDQLRSNVSGIGTTMAARTGSQWTAVTNVRAQSGPGQSLQPIAIGTAGANQIDFVALTWPDGVLQTELALAAGRLHRIEETQRQLSSCPVLFAFDGRRYAFVTDVLGVGGVGFLERPGVYSAPRPRENLLLPAGLLAPQRDRYQLKIAEPMEEVLYLDRAELVAYDVPPGWDMTLDERKEIGGPIPSGEPRFFQQLRLPVNAVTSDGGDATHAITSIDGIAASPGRVDPRFIGRTEEQSITLQFDRPLDDGGGQPTLVADGWIEYPYAQTIFAAWQAGAPYRAPSLEARDASGRWQMVLEEFGYPAGMPRQMSVALPRLPRGTTAVRLRTTQEVYWDRLAIAHVEPAPQVVRQSLPLQSAQLATTGYARRTTAGFRRPSYDYDARLPLWDARHLRGFYTAEGPVDELVSAADGAVAIVGPGEEVHLEFSATIDPPPAGWTRRFVIELRGWCKDMDLYTEHGDTVEPVPGPVAPSPARTRLHERFNTRYASGR